MRGRFIHSSFAGSYYVPCRILKETKTTYHVSFQDPISKEYLIKSMSKKNVEITSRGLTK